MTGETTVKGMAFEELIFTDADIEEFQHAINGHTYENFPRCDCFVCKEIKLLFISLGILSNRALLACFTQDGEKILVITIKQNPAYFPFLLRFHIHQSETGEILSEALLRYFYTLVSNFD